MTKNPDSILVVSKIIQILLEWLLEIYTIAIRTIQVVSKKCANINGIIDRG
jgi:hypothetical protein